ncbi:MAG: DinB family protein [Crocinitomicaceae bacterium]|nr:DinB family protein [Crocinitomicaceae bacterium]
MKIEIDLFRATRHNTLEVVKNLSLEQVNEIPDGFTGNIVWHVGHMVATHRGLVYQLNGAPGEFEKEFVLKYKKGSVPEAAISQQEWDFILGKLISQIAELEKDLANPELWKPTTEYTTSYNYTITTLDEALRFSNVHQALHLGYIMAMRRCLKNYSPN